MKRFGYLLTLLSAVCLTSVGCEDKADPPATPAPPAATDADDAADTAGDETDADAGEEATEG